MNSFLRRPDHYVPPTLSDTASGQYRCAGRQGCEPKQEHGHTGSPRAPGLLAQMHAGMRIHASYSHMAQAHSQRCALCPQTGVKAAAQSGCRRWLRHRHCMGAERQPERLKTEKDPPARVRRRHAEGRLLAEPQYTACAGRPSLPPKSNPKRPKPGGGCAHPPVHALASQSPLPPACSA